jgi:para-nitrobenzyl esterase
MKAFPMNATGGPMVSRWTASPQPGKALAWVRLLFPILLLSLVPFDAALARAGQQPPVVRVSSGVLKGYFQGNTAVFKGIPYAAPPLGALRWRAPQPAAPWRGVRDATKPASACAQDAAGLDSFIRPLASAYGVTYASEPISSSEDCLYLNVWAPQWPAHGALPVMVWLHGGSNAMGSGSQSMYDGSSLAAHGVVVVTINYRLGIFGFFSHPALTAESPHHSSGNYGLLDQLFALEWVRENITRFGGDPHAVTLFGESAGALDAGMLMTSPRAANLFRGVILESGPPFGLGPIRTLAEAEAAGTRIGQAAHGGSASAIGNLRKMSAAELMRLANACSNGSYAASAIVDGWVLTQPPVRAFASDALQKADLMVGLNGRELSAFRVMSAASKKAGKQNGSGSAMDAIRQLAGTAHPLYGAWTYAAVAKYVGMAIMHRDLAIDQATNDMLVACPVGAMAALTDATGMKVYVYQFDRGIPGKGESVLGAFHSLELPYVFNAFQDRGWRWLPFTDADLRLSAVIETYWTNFAKTGNPNGSGVPDWPAWANGSENYLELSKKGEPIAQRHFAPSFCYLSPGRLRKQLADGK